MKKYLFALMSAMLLGAIITELHFRLFPDQYFGLFLLAAIAIFLAAVGTAAVGAAVQAAEKGRQVAGEYPDEPIDDDADLAADARETGTVKWFNRNKGYGFIARDSGGEIFVHYKAIRGSGRRSLRDGQRVSFAVVGHDKGLQADNVSTLRDEPSSS
jgi:cold shock protein